ncbi:MAG: hypothetical protein JWR10_720 [Rubritepida sp.]|nr:hypothetical protein [Rubritepida sp.]
MGWFLGFVVYSLIWWTLLFCVLPLGITPDAKGELEAGGWRGAPIKPRIGRVVLITTILAAVIWVGVFLLIDSNLISFRDPWLAIPER